MSEPGNSSDLTLEEAIALAARFTLLDALKSQIEAKRAARHARIDATVDAAIAPVLVERAELFDRLEAWWPNVGDDLRKGKKSIELAGAVIGTKLGNAKLGAPKDEDSVIASLKRSAWGKMLVRTKDSLDRPGILKALQGAQKKALEKLGFSRDQDERFFIDTSADGKLGAGARTTSSQ